VDYRDPGSHISPAQSHQNGRPHFSVGSLFSDPASVHNFKHFDRLERKLYQHQENQVCFGCSRLAGVFVDFSVFVFVFVFV
jgi:hypothetical protein